MKEISDRLNDRLNACSLKRLIKWQSMARPRRKRERYNNQYEK